MEAPGTPLGPPLARSLVRSSPRPRSLGRAASSSSEGGLVTEVVVAEVHRWAGRERGILLILYCSQTALPDEFFDN